MNESTQVQKTNSKRILVALILIAVIAVAGVAYLYAGPQRWAPTTTTTTTTPENVRKDLAFREGAVTVGLTFLWASDVGDRESDKELKQLIYQVNEVFDPVQVYFWLYRSVVLTKTSVEVYPGLPGKANCTLEISDEVHNMFLASDIPIIVVRDIHGMGLQGGTCVFSYGISEEWQKKEYYPLKSYVILDPETMHNSTMNYRILTHELLHVFSVQNNAEAPEYIVYYTFPVDDLSYKVIVSGYEEIRGSAQRFNVPLPEDYSTFSL